MRERHTLPFETSQGQIRLNERLLHELALFVEIYDNAGGGSHKVDIASTVTSDEGKVMFKTDDVRDSLALKIIDDLVARGAHVRAFDPAISGPHTMIHCELLRSPLEALDADALLVLTEWPMFRDIPVSTIAGRLRQGIVIDGRNLLDHAALARAGVRYRGVGRRAMPSDVVELELTSGEVVAV